MNNKIYIFKKKKIEDNVMQTLVTYINKMKSLY